MAIAEATILVPCHIIYFTDSKNGYTSMKSTSIRSLTELYQWPDLRMGFHEFSPSINCQWDTNNICNEYKDGVDELRAWICVVHHHFELLLSNTYRNTRRTQSQNLNVSRLIL